MPVNMKNLMELRAIAFPHPSDCLGRLMGTKPFVAGHADICLLPNEVEPGAAWQNLISTDCRTILAL